MKKIKKTSNADFYDNTEQTIIQITEDKLKLKIINYTKSIKMMPEILGYLGIIISISLTLCTADFKNFKEIDGKTLQGIFLCFDIIFFLLMLSKIIIYLYHRFYKKDKIFDEDAFTQSCKPYENDNDTDVM